MAWGSSAQFPLVIAANRDEFYARPTAPLAQWTARSVRSPTSQPDTSHANPGHTIFSGRDLQDGGTWMGFSPSGRFAMLTNVRNPAAVAPSQPRSRGHLVVDWLSSCAAAADWAAQRDFAAYAGFNLIVGDWSNQQLHYLSNQKAQATSVEQKQKPQANVMLQALQPGHAVGLSNAALNAPWPKTIHLTAALGQALKAADASTDKLTAVLQQALFDPQTAPDDLLPRTGIALEQERMLSATMVRSPTYGTRASLVAILDQHGTLHLQETTHPLPPFTAAATQCYLAFRWPRALTGGDSDGYLNVIN